MGEFEILPHTADVGFRARAGTLRELFETAARAMFSLEYDLATVPAGDRREVAGGGADLEAALYSWLSELLWIHDAEGFVPGSFEVDWVDCPPSGVRVAGSARGAPLGDWFVQGGPQLKAVTLHGLEITAEADGYVATVYLDV